MQSRCRMEEENQEKCIRQYVPSVARNVKFRSNLTEADPSTAENAMQREAPQEEIGIKLTSWLPILRSQSFFFFIFSSFARTVKRHFRARSPFSMHMNNYSTLFPSSSIFSSSFLVLRYSLSFSEGLSLGCSSLMKSPSSSSILESLNKT